MATAFDAAKDLRPGMLTTRVLDAYIRSHVF